MTVCLGVCLDRLWLTFSENDISASASTGSERGYFLPRLRALDFAVTEELFNLSKVVQMFLPIGILFSFLASCDFPPYLQSEGINRESKGCMAICLQALGSFEVDNKVRCERTIARILPGLITVVWCAHVVESIEGK